MGGVEALSEVVSGLPADLRAAVLIVLHTSPESRSLLPELLSARGPLRATSAVHGEKLEQGRIYVAPSDNHMTVSDGHLHVVRGPKENGHRPAVDPLFRTAAAAFGPRVVGVVLTGALDCGTAGLLAIRSRGGLAIVQRPDEATCPSMPANALRYVPTAVVLSLAEIAPALVSLASKEMDGTFKPREAGDAEPHQTPPFGLTCPSCHGALTETAQDDYPGFRCHVGHVFSLKGLVSLQAEGTEAALWAAIRALKECATIAENVARRSPPSLAARFNEKAASMKQHADVILGVVLGGDMLTEDDGDASETVAEG